jgi:hypothetical protein
LTVEGVFGTFHPQAVSELVRWKLKLSCLLGGKPLKKQLLCTSAIALGVAAAPAAAQDWNLDWGGFYNTHVAYADVGGSDPRAQAAFGAAAYNLIDFGLA